jgi:hypothetical protein
MTNRKQLRDEEQNWENEIFETEGDGKMRRKGRPKDLKVVHLKEQWTRRWFRYSLLRAVEVKRFLTRRLMSMDTKLKDLNHWGEEGLFCGCDFELQRYLSSIHPSSSTESLFTHSDVTLSEVCSIHFAQVCSCHGPRIYPTRFAERWTPPKCIKPSIAEVCQQLKKQHDTYWKVLLSFIHLVGAVFNLQSTTPLGHTIHFTDRLYDVDTWRRLGSALSFGPPYRALNLHAQE